MLSKKIKEIRKMQELTQMEFCKMFDIGYSSLGHYESGRSIPSGDVLIKICAQYPEYAAWLLTDDRTALNTEQTTPAAEALKKADTTLSKKTG